MRDRIVPGRDQDGMRDRIVPGRDQKGTRYDPSIPNYQAPIHVPLRVSRQERELTDTTSPFTLEDKGEVTCSSLSRATRMSRKTRQGVRASSHQARQVRRVGRCRRQERISLYGTKTAWDLGDKTEGRLPKRGQRTSVAVSDKRRPLEARWATCIGYHPRPAPTVRSTPAVCRRCRTTLRGRTTES